MTELASKRRQKKLIDGRYMTCPRCKKQHDVIQYVPLETIEEFAAETTPCYKCPSCKWIFAPAERLSHDLLLDLTELVSELKSQLAQRENDAN
jgi:rubredoxin